MFVSTYYAVANVNQSTRTFGKTSDILVIQTLINRVNMIKSKLFQQCVYVNVLFIKFIYNYKKNFVYIFFFFLLLLKLFILSHVIYCIVYFVLNMTLYNVQVFQLNYMLCSVNISNFHSTVNHYLIILFITVLLKKQLMKTIKMIVKCSQCQARGKIVRLGNQKQFVLPYNTLLSNLK